MKIDELKDAVDPTQANNVIAATEQPTQADPTINTAEDASRTGLSMSERQIGQEAENPKQKELTRLVIENSCRTEHKRIDEDKESNREIGSNLNSSPTGSTADPAAKGAVPPADIQSKQKL